MPDILAVGCFALLILNTAHVEGKVKTLLNNKVMTYLGEISYSIYMVHMSLIFTPFIISMLIAPSGEEVYSNSPPETTDVNYLMNWTAALLFALIVIGVASLTYRYLEVPMRRKIKRSGFTTNMQPKEAA